MVNCLKRTGKHYSLISIKTLSLRVRQTLVQVWAPLSSMSKSPSLRIAQDYFDN